jgi:hypothetical protein
VATYRAIAATSEALRSVLESACPRADFPDARFELFQASDFQQQLDEGVSIWLYRVAVNAARRNLPPTITPEGRRVRPPLPIDLFYLISAWGRSIARQHELLAWCMRALEDVSVLPSGVLNGPGPDDDTFRAYEGLELVCESLPLAELHNLWDIIRPNIPVSATYVARFVALESTIPLPEAGPPTQTREFGFSTWSPTPRR